MVLVKKFRLADINTALFVEEVLAAITLPVSIGFAGFDDLDRRRITPAPGRKEVGRSSEFGIDFADPGELRIGTERDLTPTEDSALDSAISSHDETQRTASQVRADKDDVIKDVVISNLRRAQWDGLNNPDRLETLRRACQLLFRGHSEENFDTDD